MASVLGRLDAEGRPRRPSGRPVVVPPPGQERDEAPERSLGCHTPETARPLRRQVGRALPLARLVAAEILQRPLDSAAGHPLGRERRGDGPPAAPSHHEVVPGQVERERLVVDEPDGLQPGQLRLHVIPFEPGPEQARAELVARARPDREEQQSPIVTAERLLRLARTPGPGQPFP